MVQGLNLNSELVLQERSVKAEGSASHPTFGNCDSHVSLQSQSKVLHAAARPLRFVGA